MKTAGEILKEAREEKKITLDEAAASTKIKKGFLEDIEENNFQKFSSGVVARGLIKNYAEFLGLSSKPILAIFKRDFRIGRKREIIRKELGKLLNQSGFSWSPKLTLVTVIGLAVFILLFYLGYQYFSLVREPELEIFQPREGQEVLTKKLEIAGKTDSDAVVTVNGNLVSSFKGEFSSVLSLLPGENKIVVEATNRLGRKTRVERSVFFFDTER